MYHAIQESPKQNVGKDAAEEAGCENGGPGDEKLIPLGARLRQD